MLQPWQNATVVNIIDETPNTKRFFIEIADVNEFNFLPGQFVTLDLPIHESRNKRWRSYSIASAPDGTNIIELVIVLLPTGLGTTYLFNRITIGSTLSLRGPQGVFVLPKDLSTDLFLICTGTGIAPFRSMVKYIHDKQLAHRSIYLIFGCRKLEDTLYLQELTELEKSMPNFYYLPTYSRETAVDVGSIGYVHAVYKKLLLETGIEEKQFMLCGWKAMIDEAKENLLGLGVDKKAIHAELYG